MGKPSSQNSPSLSCWQLPQKAVSTGNSHSTPTFPVPLPSVLLCSSHSLLSSQRLQQPQNKNRGGKKRINFLQTCGLDRSTNSLDRRTSSTVPAAKPGRKPPGACEHSWCAKRGSLGRQSSLYHMTLLQTSTPAGLLGAQLPLLHTHIWPWPLGLTALPHTLPHSPSLLLFLPSLLRCGTWVWYIHGKPQTHLS